MKPDLEISPPNGTGRTMPRREFLRALAVLVAAGATGQSFLAADYARADDEAALLFPDGIKSGDPAPRSAVIWTRVATASTERVVVLWSVAEDALMQNVVRGGVRTVGAATGHNLHVKVRGLRPDRWYHYRFEVQGVGSVVGRLRTAPSLLSSPDHLRYAFASCQQRTQSHYVAHRAIAKENVDFLLHLGDYVYVNDSATLTVDDYRSVYQRFHSNPDLQALQAQVPLVAVWDDGEFYNGVDRTGDSQRLANARQAWFEAMPVMRNLTDRTYRSLRWGNLAELMLLDTRQYRDPEVPANATFAGLLDAQDTTIPPGEEMFEPGRTTLGKWQLAWLARRLARTRAQWKILGSSYDMAPWKLVDFDTPELRAADPELQKNGGIYVSNEAWDDYQDERRKLMRYIESRKIANVLVSAGHTHFYKASNIQPDCDDINSPITAMEFVTGSLTADPLPTEIAPIELLQLAETIMLQANDPYLRHVDLLNQGYVVVDVTPEETIVEFRVIDTLDSTAEAQTRGRFRVVNGIPGIETLA
ncbi:Alkaline phosphatase D [Halioglobus japonicus]|nr:Alkaline phosphatase D [Halioglobus japonicus]